MALKRQTIVADFETTTKKDDCRVWAACAVDIETAETVYIGNSLPGFLGWLQGFNTVCYFHNSKFDCSFILDYILKNGYQYSPEPKENCFSTLITDTGVFYSVTIWFKKQNKNWKKVVFYDSMKKLPFKVATISKAFGLKDEKLHIDYDAPRPPGHVLTEDEERYIVNDCRIVAQALKIQFSQGLTHMTNASDAMNGYKKIIGKKQFENLFPVFPVEMDKKIRRSYKGGFVWVNPRYQGIRGLQGRTYDINSLYPWTMYHCMLPYSYPLYFEGEPVDNPDYPLFIALIQCSFELKPDHIPTIQLKHNLRFNPAEYVSSSKGEIIPMVLTSVDIQLLRDHYDVENLEYIYGYRFRGSNTMFRPYIDYWMSIKENNEGALRQLAKLQLNSLYGRFCMNPKAYEKVPYLRNDRVQYLTIKTEEDAKLVGAKPPELRDPVFTALGAFVTSYAREKTIRSAQAVFDRFIYADTDSLSLVGDDVPDILDVHPTRLGAWKDEGVFTDSLFIRPKTYLKTVYSIKKRDKGEDTLENYCKLLQADNVEWLHREADGIHYGIIKVTCAGMPDGVHDQVTYDNFKMGTHYPGKLVPRIVPGGVVLEDVGFTIN